MDLNILWFILITILFTGYFILEGFDFGVGVLLPFLSKDDIKRRIIINTIGPHWDGNEVWLITAGGAIFAAFPNWYATLFSGFYLPLFFILLALIFRGVAFEFRSKDENLKWRAFWDWAIFGGSLLPALLWGVAFSNFVRGVPVDGNMNYIGGFWNLINGYSLLGGVFSLLLFTLHGALFLSLKTSGELVEKSRSVAGKLWFPTLIAYGGWIIASFSATDIMGHNAFVLPLSILGLISLLVSGWFIRQEKSSLPFILSTLTILLSSLVYFLGLFPRVLVSSLNPLWDLTIYNSSSSPYTLKVMSIIALIFVPIVLVYQGWSYWVFRKRIGEQPESLEY